MVCRGRCQEGAAAARPEPHQEGSQERVPGGVSGGVSGAILCRKNAAKISGKSGFPHEMPQKCRKNQCVFCPSWIAKT